MPVWRWRRRTAIAESWIWSRATGAFVTESGPVSAIVTWAVRTVAAVAVVPEAGAAWAVAAAAAVVSEAGAVGAVAAAAVVSEARAVRTVAAVVLVIPEARAAWARTAVVGIADTVTADTLIIARIFSLMDSSVVAASAKVWRRS